MLNIHLAWESMKKAKLRNFLTMFGIIIGVLAVVTTVSIGEGLKRQVGGHIKSVGDDLLLVRPGRVVNRDRQGAITSVNLLAPPSAQILTDQDVDAVTETAGVRAAAPLSSIEGVPGYQNEEYPQVSTVATTSNFAELLNHKVAFGEFLSDADEGENFAVIGKHVAERMFKQNVPLGRAFSFRGETLVVKGVFEEFQTNSLALGIDLNNTIFIPYTTGKIYTQDRAQVFEIVAKPTKSSQVDTVQKAIEQNLLKIRNNQPDFSVLKQAETQAIANNLVFVITGLVASIATIALIVGGVGIMNVMLVSVTERTQEIGIRKAVGATNRQILMQFLVEAMMLSVVGSLIGVLLSLLIAVGLRLYTNIETVIVWPVIAVVFAISVLAGVLFGVMPALKAARKTPIEALRNE